MCARSVVGVGRPASASRLCQCPRGKERLAEVESGQGTIGGCGDCSSLVIGVIELGEDVDSDIGDKVGDVGDRVMPVGRCGEAADLVMVKG